MPGAERVLDFADRPVRLSVRHEQLVIRDGDEPEVTTPLAEAAIAIVASPRLSCTGAALAGLMRHGGSMVICDDSATPVGLMLPLGVNQQQTKRVLAQAAASLPTNKRLWQQVVRAKIAAQARTLELHTGDDAGLPRMATRVKSGDPDNLEAQAARRYWPALFGPSFRRRREAEDQNRLLNYGYAVLRAAVGRSICASGLHPSVGIHHHDRHNSFCLADDLMEPYRPVVDDEVADIVHDEGPDAPLDKETKARLIGVLHARLHHRFAPGEEGVPGELESRTVIDWIGRTAASLAAVYLGEAPKLFYPQGLHRAAPRA